MENTSSLITDRITDVFKMLMWFHCFDIFSTAIDKTRLSAMSNYHYGAIIGLIIQSVLSSWTQLLCIVIDRALSANLVTHLWYNHKTGCYKHIYREDVFSPLSQLQSSTLFVQQIQEGGAGLTRQLQSVQFRWIPR